MALLFVTVDLGRPDRFHHLMLRFNFPISMLTWDVISLNGYLLLNLHICGYLIYCRVPEARARASSSTSRSCLSRSSGRSASTARRRRSCIAAWAGARSGTRR
jgi:formate-dependent nitrite reductase membrane component NrfD